MFVCETAVLYLLIPSSLPDNGSICHNINEISDVDCIDTAQNKGQWWATLNMAMSLRII
jgi:hypothetical protein